MSSGEAVRDIENVRQAITDDLEAALKHLESKWKEAATFFEAAVSGYSNLNGVDSVRRGFAEGEQVITDFVAKQVFTAAMLGIVQQAL